MATKILITGSTGFLGSELKRSIKAENFVELKNVDILSRGGPSQVLEQADDNNCDLILHLAWNSNSNPNYEKSDVHREWLLSSLELAELCNDKGVIFAGVGTCLDEEVHVENKYINAKQALKNALRQQIIEQNILWIRPYFVFCPVEKRPRLTRAIYEKEGIPLELKNGNSRNDYVHISDVGRALSLLVMNECMGQIDIGSGYLTSNYSFAKHIASLMDRPTPISTSEYKVDGPVADVSILAQLGWTPSYTAALLGNLND
jgi:nucleoside-diphosphate-sugar epimerase